MTFGFYHSLVTIKSDLQEAASVYRMNRWQRFTKLELPSSAIGLMWNSGLRPRVARIAQPLAQIAASFPVNITFPFVVGFFIAAHIPIDFGSVLLMALGTQWYNLFNVIAGAMAIPTDLREAAMLFGLARWRLWKTLIIPAIFPFWVTGAVTATGGAWNASIVAEVATWGNDKLVADGLGAYIAQVTEKGDKPAIYFSIVVMAMFVVFINRVFWRRLYDLAERRFRLD